MEDAWNYITLQQVSGDSGILSTYYPYIAKISEYVKQHAPGAEQLLHQTWAYEIDSEHPDFSKYGRDQRKMYQAITETYDKLARDLSLRSIPCGAVIQALRSCPSFDYANGGISLCRDGFHMNLVYGRYALAAIWFEFILKQSILKNTFLPPADTEIDVDIKKIEQIKDIVHTIANP